jgi:hypothetical protein
MTNFRMPSLDDFADAEHCVLEDLTSEPVAAVPALEGSSSEAREVREQHEIRDRLRGRTTRVVLYSEGWADVETLRRGRRSTHHRIDLRFLDATPETSRYVPVRLLKAGGILAAITALFALPAAFGWHLNVTLTATIVGAVATLSVLFVAFYLTREKIVFQTLHGRAGAMHFGAGLGTMRRFHKLVPKLVEAIGGAAEHVHDDTAVYLRAEMREHYRLRSAGILTNEECSESTGRILARFDSAPL